MPGYECHSQRPDMEASFGPLIEHDGFYRLNSLCSNRVCFHRLPTYSFLSFPSRASVAVGNGVLVFFNRLQDRRVGDTQKVVLR